MTTVRGVLQPFSPHLREPLKARTDHGGRVVAGSRSYEAAVEHHPADTTAAALDVPSCWASSQSRICPGQQSAWGRKQVSIRRDHLVLRGGEQARKVEKEAARRETLIKRNVKHGARHRGCRGGTQQLHEPGQDDHARQSDLHHTLLSENPTGYGACGPQR